jgi:hypothetical protein
LFDSLFDALQLHDSTGDDGGEVGHDRRQGRDGHLDLDLKTLRLLSQIVDLGG